MKKKYRDKALNALFDEMNHKDFDTRENALFQLGLMLERSNHGTSLADMPDVYSENLSRDLLRITFSDDDQNLVIDNLSRLIVTHKDSRPTSFWSLGKAKGELAFIPLLSLIGATGHQLNNEAAYQACDALKRWLDAGLGEGETRAEQLRLQDPTPALKRWTTTSDERLSLMAEEVLEILG